MPADMARLMGDILSTMAGAGSYLRGKELPFNYAGEILLHGFLERPTTGIPEQTTHYRASRPAKSTR